MSDSRLVYTTDPSRNQKCPRCKELLSECRCETGMTPGPHGPKFVAVLRIEKTGRQGKTVTVVDGLPKMETYLKPLCKELKTKCGAGGTFRTDGRDGIIEVQGDQRERIRGLLESKSIKVKG